MRRATLVVQNFSHGYVARFIDYLHGVLRRHIDDGSRLVLCDTIDGAAYPEGLVFIVGENFPPFRRRPGCTYIGLNLSVVTPLGSPFAASLNGYRQIYRKRRMLAAKLALCDALLDYYPAQTRVLSSRLSLPVLGFPFAVAPEPRAPLAHDVCFVGKLTARRRRILSDLSGRGHRLSPHSSLPIEEVAAASALCLNIHTERSNHLEIPRLVAALAAGCPVVTETSHGLSDFATGDFVVERPLRELADTVANLLSDPEDIAGRGEAGATWYREKYLPAADARWADICATLTDLADRPARHA